MIDRISKALNTNSASTILQAQELTIWASRLAQLLNMPCVNFYENPPSNYAESINVEMQKASRGATSWRLAHYVNGIERPLGIPGLETSTTIDNLIKNIELVVSAIEFKTRLDRQNLLEEY